MLADIVERLSNWKHASFRRDGSTLETMMEAADEITSLRAELAKKPVLLVHGFYSTNTNKYYLDESDAVKAGNAYAVYTATPPKE